MLIIITLNYDYPPKKIKTIKLSLVLKKIGLKPITINPCWK